MARFPYVRALVALGLGLATAAAASMLAAGGGRREPADRSDQPGGPGNRAAGVRLRRRLLALIAGLGGSKRPAALEVSQAPGAAALPENPGTPIAAAAPSPAPPPAHRSHVREILAGSVLVLAPVAVVLASAMIGGGSRVAAYPSQQKDCSLCHGTMGVYPNAVTAAPSSTNLAPGAAYTVAITMSTPVNGATGTGYWIANSDAGGATGTTTGVYAGGAGQGAAGKWTANMTAPSTPGTYYYKVFGQSGPADASGDPGYALYSITVQSASTPTSTPVPPTATSVPPTSTPVPPTATSAPPTSTPVPPTNTPAPATATATRTVTPTMTATTVPPTSTAVPPTVTTVPPTSTAVPPTATTVPPTSTAAAATATATAAASTPTATATATPAGTAPTATPTAQCGGDDEDHGEHHRRDDVDGDRRVTGRDLFIVLRGAYLARLGLLRQDQVALLDVDGDGHVTFRDAVQVLRHVLDEDTCED